VGTRIHHNKPGSLGRRGDELPVYVETMVQGKRAKINEKKIREPKLDHIW